jgi:hypothetical protein
MLRSSRLTPLIGSLVLAFLWLALGAQEPPPPPEGGPPGRGGPGGFGGVRERTKLVERFDRDGDHRLNGAERKAAREFLAKEIAEGRGPRGPGGRGGFGPGMMLAPEILSQADKDGDRKLSREEFTALADGWFDKLDPGATGKLSEEEFTERLREVLPPPPGAGGPEGGPPGGGPGGGDGRGRGPGRFLGPSLFKAAGAGKDGSLTRSDLKATFGKWFTDWVGEKGGLLDEEKIRAGLSKVLGRPGRGPGGPGFRGRGEKREPPRPGPKLSAAEVKKFPEAGLYDPATLRTLFLEFEEPDWEKELADFHGTDVEVPARLEVDGKVYREVGVHFRGMSSYMMVGEGQKRSLNLSLDFAHPDQEIHSYRTLDLLNSHEDPTFLRSVLFSRIAREYIPTPNANLVRVVINGESWGIYVNSEEYNKDFLRDWFGTQKGARWKVPGSPGGRGSLAYLGEDPAPYKRIYQLRTKDRPKAWADLIRLTKVLNETAPDKLEETLSPLLDIDGALKFLALDNVLINNDGYWVRTSDYNIYEDEKGRFHIIPHDTNETFVRPEGPGFGGGPGGPRGPGPGAGPGGPGGPAGEGPEGRRGPGGPGSGRGPRIKGVELDPLLAANDERKPLISKLLKVPALRARYLGYVRDITEKWLDWKRLGPLVEEYQSLIAADVKSDTRKLDSTEDFTRGATGTGEEEGGPSGISLKSFVEKRRAYLLSHPEVKRAGS